MQWLYLAIAILGEVAGTTALKASEGLTRPGPVAVTAVGFTVALVFLGLTLKTMPVGVAYAIWSGTGVVLIALIGLAVFGQTLDRWALIGMVLIVAGVMVINLLSDSVRH